MKALVAVADAALRQVWESVLAERGHTVRRAAPGPAAWVAYQHELPNLVVIERLPSASDALELCRRIRRHGAAPRPAVFVLLHLDQGGELIAALRAGADDVLVAPIDPPTARAHLAAVEWRLHPAPPAPTARELAGFQFAELEAGTAPAPPPVDIAAVRPIRAIPAVARDAAPPADRAPALELRPVAAGDADLIDALPDGVVVVDGSGLVAFANPAAARLFQRDRAALGAVPLDTLLRWTVPAVAPPSQLLLARARCGPHRESELAAVPTDGVEILCEVCVVRLPAGAQPARWIVVLYDGRERQRREAAVRDAALREARAALAQGAVNDFSNAVAAILGSIEAVRLALPADAAIAQAELACLRDATRAASALLRRLRQLATPAPSERRPIDPQVLIDDAARELAAELPPNVRLLAECGHTPWSVEADPEQLTDLLVGLGLAARDAMPRGGTLTIGSARVLPGPGDPAAPPDLPAHEYVRIDVRDTGAGAMPDQDADEAGSLARASAHTVLRQHDGGVSVERVRGHGTVVRLFLPRSRAAGLRLVGARTEGGAARPRTGGTVLLIDDDPRVRRPLRQALEHCGYTVLEAGDGDQGLQVHARHPEIAIAVVDHRMPKLSGWEVLLELKRRRSDLPVVLVSGYALGDVALGQGPRPDAFLRKPFELVDLASTVRRLLSAGA